MKQAQFESRHRSALREFNSALDEAKKRRIENPERFIALYQEVCHLQAIAHGRGYSLSLLEMLDRSVDAGHAILYQKRTSYLGQFLQFVIADFGRVLRAEARFFWLAFALFFGPLFAVVLAGWINPDVPIMIMGHYQATELEMMYDPSHAIIGEARDSESNWLMFGHYIRNNITIAFRCFASGVVLMVGTLFLTIYNGLFIGAAASHINNVGYYETFYGFVVGHGSFELIAIVIACAAGLKIGFALIMPGQLSRIESLKQSGRIAIQLMLGSLILLVIAAFVEAFWSSNNLLPFTSKLIIGLLGWALLAWYLVRSGRRYDLRVT